MNSDYTVIFFSGTGNSRYVAEKIAAGLDCALVDLGKKIKNSDYSPLKTGKNVVAVVPIYFFRLPDIVRDYLQKIRLCDAENIWYVMTYGGQFGNCDKYNRNLSEAMSLNHMGTCGVEMPCNHITMMDTPDAEQIQLKLKDADDAARSLIDLLMAGKAFKACSPSFADKAKSIVSPLISSVMIKDKSFFSSDKCTGCGTCEKLCPLNNISLIDGKPRWGGRCTHCLACINLCPAQAIEYGKKTAGRRRYHI